jgi:tRNA-specific 2-thiouridylase
VHEGAVFITIGQRHGFTITEKSPDDKPYYVISKDIVCNTITVSDDLAQVTESMEESKSLLTLSNVILNTEINQDKIYTARVRYRQELKECRLTQLTNGGLEVQFVTPQLNPSKGQSCVIYDGELCIGGGIIE